MLRSKIHERLSIRGTRRVCRKKRYVFAQFSFDCPPSLTRATAKNHASAFLKEAPQYGFADSSCATGNYGNLIIQPDAAG
jgi:hypothetical protein